MMDNRIDSASSVKTAYSASESGTVLYYWSLQPGTILMASKATGIPVSRVKRLFQRLFFSLMVYEYKFSKCKVSGRSAQWYKTGISEQVRASEAFVDACNKLRKGLKDE